MTTEPSAESVERACAAFRKSLIDGNYYAMTMGNVTGRVLHDAMRAALAALAPARDGWRPIESAPRDGAPVLLFAPKGEPGHEVCVGWWIKDDCEGETDGGGTWREDGAEPTHWQPLPAAPHPAARRPTPAHRTSGGSPCPGGGRT